MSFSGELGITHDAAILLRNNSKGTGQGNLMEFPKRLIVHIRWWASRPPDALGIYFNCNFNIRKPHVFKWTSLFHCAL